MAVSGTDKPRFESLLEDIDHPNPNINNQAFILMRRHWPKKSLDYFIRNLDSDNNEKRRKTVKALSVYEEDVVLPMPIITASLDAEIPFAILTQTLAVKSCERSKLKELLPS